MDDRKVYVDVIAAFANDGRILPLSLTWEDGREFKIDQVVDIRPAAAMKAGGQGDRYTVRVQCRDKYKEPSALLNANGLSPYCLSVHLSPKKDTISL